MKTKRAQKPLEIDAMETLPMDDRARLLFGAMRWQRVNQTDLCPLCPGLASCELCLGHGRLRFKNLAQASITMRSRVDLEEALGIPDQTTQQREQRSRKS